MKSIFRNIIIVLIAIAVNVLGRFIANYYSLPIWLDMVGSGIAVYYTGVWGGILTGIFGNLLSGFFDVSAIIYIIIGIIVAVVLWSCVKKGYLDNAYKAALTGFWLGVLSMLLSTPINMIFYNGYAGNIWGDALVDMMKWYDMPLWFATLMGEGIVEITDKQITVMLVFLVIKLVNKVNAKGKKADAGQALGMITGLCIVLFWSCPMEASAFARDLFEDNYVQTVYDNTNGMVSTEANVICETNDGFIWIGSYAGLTRYDGQEFEFIREGGLVNVTCMMTDSKGRLWIGTNDAGIARYENGTYTYFTTANGLPTDSVRCFAEDAEGNVYVGTSGKICKFSEGDSIEVPDWDVTFAKSMVIYDNRLVVMDNVGKLHVLRPDGTELKKSFDLQKYFFYCLNLTSRGVMSGTDSGELFVLAIENDQLTIQEQIPIYAEEISAIYEDSRKRVWVGTDKGFGHLVENNQFHEIKSEVFESSIDYFHEDYQGNMWLASSRYGVMKLTPNKFANLFEEAGVEKTIVNAVVKYKNNFYCGTDKGLYILGEKMLIPRQNQLTELTDDSRVRSLFVDSQNRLWVCSYDGLHCYDGSGKIRTYTTETDGTTSDRFRCITELKDGTFAVGTADGLNFIQNDQLVYTLGAQDGMENTQILSVVAGPDGSLWAGSDGSGIYVISDGKICDVLTVEDGLSSNIILRIVPYEKGYLVVTSNSLCHIDGKGQIQKLDKFPYFNNYDIIVSGDSAFITCSAGLYKTDLDTLCKNEEGIYKLYNAKEGMFSGLTANAWNYMDENGRLYLCSNNGVTVFKDVADDEPVTLKSGIISVEYDGSNEAVMQDGIYTLPSNAKNVSIHASVRNYAFTDSKIRFFIKGTEETAHMYEWDEIAPISVAKPEDEEYELCLQVIDSTTNEVLQESTYYVRRDTPFWETDTYKIYLILVGTEIILFVVISIIAIILIAFRKNQLEQMQIRLENTVQEQTKEIQLQETKAKNLFMQTVLALSETVDAKDRYTSGHSRRVAEYAMMIAARMGKSKEEQEEIYHAGLLHDVGKIRVPGEIINKKDKLTDDEYRLIKIHPITGYHILRGISGNRMIAIGAKYHHERYDGKGYPNGLDGENIPEIARILGVADSYDAMTSHRSYRRALPQHVVREEIEKGRGTQFDPVIADIMLQMMDEDIHYELHQADSMQKEILVVDDEEMSVKIIERIMRDEPVYHISSAYSGEEALEILEHKHFDLILLDVLMPGMDGFETLRRIRKKYRTPVVLLTGDKTLGSVNGEELGCDDYITKPFQPLIIKEVVHNMTESMIIET